MVVNEWILQEFGFLTIAGGFKCQVESPNRMRFERDGTGSELSYSERDGFDAKLRTDGFEIELLTVMDAVCSYRGESPDKDTEDEKVQEQIARLGTFLKTEGRLLLRPLGPFLRRQPSLGFGTSATGWKHGARQSISVLLRSEKTEP